MLLQACRSAPRLCAQTVSQQVHELAAPRTVWCCIARTLLQVDLLQASSRSTVQQLESELMSARHSLSQLERDFKADNAGEVRKGYRWVQMTCSHCSGR
jgi:hypothetical protein